MKTTITKTLGFLMLALALLGSLAGAAHAMQSSDSYLSSASETGTPEGTREATLDATHAANVHLSGIVSAIDATTWTVGGSVISVANAVHIGAGIVVGDKVEVEAVKLADGTLSAIEINKIQATPEATKHAESENENKPGLTKTPEATETETEHVKSSVTPAVTKESEQEHKPAVSVTPEPKETEPTSAAPQVTSQSSEHQSTPEVKETPKPGEH